MKKDLAPVVKESEIEMIRCAVCKGLTKPGETTHLVVVETRAKEYINWKHDGYGGMIEIRSSGWEIVKEIRVDSVCALLTMSEMQREGRLHRN